MNVDDLFNKYADCIDYRHGIDCMDKEHFTQAIAEILSNPRGVIKDAINISSQLEPLVTRKPTEIKDRRGNMIYFGDKLRFANKAEWYKNDYFVSVLMGDMTYEQAREEIEKRPHEERIVESVQDYEWLLSPDIQTYWELSA